MQHVEMARDKLFNLRISAGEWSRFEALAAHYGLSVASMLRMLAKRDADILALAETPPRSMAEALAKREALEGGRYAGELAKKVSKRDAGKSPKKPTKKKKPTKGVK